MENMEFKPVAIKANVKISDEEKRKNRIIAIHIKTMAEEEDNKILLL